MIIVEISKMQPPTLAIIVGTKKTNMETIIIGIDPGVKTGFAIKDLKTGIYTSIETLKIYQGFEKINLLLEKPNLQIYVIVEDARKRKWFGDTSRERLQGAGSVKRDSKAWEDFLIDKEIPHRLQAPKATKTNSKLFQKIIPYKGRTSEHAREAAMFIRPINKNTLKMFFLNKK